MTTLDHHASVRPVPNPSKSLITKLNMGTGVVLGVIFALATYYGMGGDSAGVFENYNRTLLATLFMWSIGFMVGIGAFIGPFRWLIGKDLTD